VIGWSTPDNGGSSITGYKVQMRQSDLATFSQVTCTETMSNVVSFTVCSVSIASARGAPFNLAWGSSILAKIVATNVYGDSVPSESGNGAVILTYPDAPVNLANNVALTSSSQIGFSWA